MKKSKLQVATTALPRGLPSLARERLQALGPGEVVDRTRLTEVCGTKAAADQFCLALAPRGYMVPVAWGLHAIPRPGTLRKLAVLAHASVAQAVAWGETLPWALDPPRPFALLGLASWADPLLNIPSPAPVFTLRREDAVVRGAAPQLEAFFADLLRPMSRLDLTDDEGQVLGELPCLHPLDEARILQVNADSRFREAAKRRKALLTPEDRHTLLGALRKTGFPEPAPRGRDAVRLPTGPPFRYRLYAPPWFLALHRDALDVGARGRTLA